MRPARLSAPVLAALVVASALTTHVGTVPRAAAAAAACGTYRSETSPPATIRVYRTATGEVDTVDFRAYVKNVLSREWIPSWATEALRAGALAVKSYAWYQVIHWRGYVNESGECFDVFDSTRDQHYDSARPTYRAMADAVDATWSTRAHRGGRIFPTYYNAGSSSAACAVNANGWQMSQWGSQACALAGKTAAQIVSAYYAGATVTNAMPAPTPIATPISTPKATPEPPKATPTPKPTGKPTPPPSAPAQPTPPPATPLSTPTPTTEAPSAPPPSAPPASADPAAQPGGGQSGLVAPPPPPPADPEPIVVSALRVSPRETPRTPARTALDRVSDPTDPSYEARQPPDRGGVIDAPNDAAERDAWTAIRDAVAGFVAAVAELLAMLR